MYVTPDMLDLLDQDYTQAQVDTLMNNLVLDPQGFSKIACLDGRAYGVETLCDTCLIDLNWCVRKQIPAQLINAQKLIEDKLMYPVTKRYAEEKIMWRGKIRHQLKFAGIEAVNVEETISVIDEFDPVVEVDPFNQYVLVTANTIEISRELNPNPDKILMTNEDNHAVYLDDNNVISKGEDGTWIIPILNMPDDTEVRIFNCDFIYVEAPYLEVENGSVYPVYTGTNQKIPMAKPPRIVNEEFVIYTFHPFVLLDPAFYEQGANLAQREFYKLVETIEFRKFAEVEAMVSVEYFTCGCTPCDTTTTEETDDISVTITDAERGIITIDTCNFRRCSSRLIVSMTVKFRVNPDRFNGNAYGTVKTAIANKVAADLPLNACNCDFVDEAGPLVKYRGTFIYNAQKLYTEKRVSVTGDVIENFKHGSMYGQVVFSEKLNELKRFNRSIRI